MMENVPNGTGYYILIIFGIFMWILLNRKHGGMICLNCKSKYKEKHVQINICPKCNGVLINDIVLIKDNIELNPLLKKIFCIRNGKKQLKNMQQNSKKHIKAMGIQVPYLVISPSLLHASPDIIFIKDKQLIYKVHDSSTKKNKSFDLDNMKKFLMSNKKLTGLTKDFKLDPWGLIGAEIELYIVDVEDNKHILIPKFFMPSRNLKLKDWENFLYELCEYSNLPIEKLVEPVESK